MQSDEQICYLNDLSHPFTCFRAKRAVSSHRQLINLIGARLPQGRGSSSLLQLGSDDIRQPQANYRYRLGCGAQQRIGNGPFESHSAYGLLACVRVARPRMIDATRRKNEHRLRPASTDRGGVYVV